LKNVLIDKQVNWLAKDENRELIKDFKDLYEEYAENLNP